MLGWLLLAYAAIGALLVAVALAIGGPLVARVERLTSSATETISAATDAAQSAADSFQGFDSSLEQARSSAGEAASLSRDTAITLDGLAQAMTISIFGAQPLEPLAGRFETSASQLRQMGDSLDEIGEALGTNREDVSEVGLELQDLAVELRRLQGRISAEQRSTDLPLSWLYYGFLLWQLLPIAAAAVGGGILLRRPRPVTI
ncbi:MAG TPA: hypothetical protein VHK28_07520 [Candidatus Limnocylindria bacterium]|nr:hypothetical protein [Candidatus Limnocylindria bacterium]